ncbi:unnamed protein product [marine sediment metagenome]|uniref:Uncharacterized protein n=2 Tax=marine sediment metagenome TaxID=412755 RepID=X1A687_9ZZZZ
MYIHKSLKLAILALFIGTLVIFSGCTAPPINHAPTIISAEITATFVEAAYTYDVDAIDPDTGDILELNIFTVINYTTKLLKILLFFQK